MRRIWWILAVVLTLATYAHYSADQDLAEKCANGFSYAEHSCFNDKFSENGTIGSENGFISNHFGLIAITLFSVILSIFTVIFGVVNSKKPLKRLLMIDNYDSFTFNLVQYFGQLGVDVIVKRNDEIELDEIEQMAPDYIVISPGPCTPNEAGISLKVIEAFAGKLPILGVCLGHQAIAQVYGASVVRAQEVMHGKTSWIYHEDVGVFHELEQPFQATRYHSLVVEKASFEESLADDFILTAWTESDHDSFEYIMGIKHKKFALEGVQFHPESIMSEQGHALLKNFLKYNADYAQEHTAEKVPVGMIEKGAIR